MIQLQGLNVVMGQSCLIFATMHVPGERVISYFKAVQAKFCCYPQKAIAIFCDSGNMIVAQAAVISGYLLIRVKNECGRIETIQSATICADPYDALRIFEEGSHVIVGETASDVWVIAVTLERAVPWIITIQPIFSADP